MADDAAVSTPTYRLLIAEDNDLIGQVLRTVFDEAGYAITWVKDGDEALRRLEEDETYDVLVLDIRLPGADGFEVLAYAKRERSLRPAVLMITCLDDQESIIKGFELGADDYLVKPFRAEELLARVRAILRRVMPPPRTPMMTRQVGKLDVNFSTYEAYDGDEEVALTPLEYDLLSYLLAHRGEVVTREQLLTDVWGLPASVHTRTIDRHISSLRKKIEPDPAAPQYLTTIHGVGYQLNEPSNSRKGRREPLYDTD